MHARLQSSTTRVFRPSTRLPTLALGALPPCVVLVSLRVSKVDHRPILRFEAAEALRGLRDALLIGRNDLAGSSGSIRADSAVEPTKLENITVTWRRSARSSGRALLVLDVIAASTKGVYRSRRHAAPQSQAACPTAGTPDSFRSSAVRVSSNVSSKSFSRKIAPDFPRPRLRSQTTMSLMARLQSGLAHIICREASGMALGFSALAKHARV
jgi:hypothetical protein